jgi:hypothetical protein
MPESIQVAPCPAVWVKVDWSADFYSAGWRKRMTKYLRDHFDPWSLVVIALTFTLFLTALFLQGLSHEILLEAGVFLVSIKLIMMSHKNSVLAKKTELQLGRIYTALQIGNSKPE